MKTKKSFPSRRSPGSAKSFKSGTSDSSGQAGRSAKPSRNVKSGRPSSAFGATRSGGSAKPGKSGRYGKFASGPVRPDAPRPLNFRQAFDALWTKLFTTPIHLDSALSQSPPSQKSALAVMSRLLLQRPYSLAKYLRFYLSEEEPWGLDRESLATWPTARSMSDRLFTAWKKDASFTEGGRALPGDYPTWMVDEWRRDFKDQVAKYLVETLAEPPPLSVRASRLQGGRDKILSELNDSGELEMRAKASQVAPFGFYFPDYAPVLGHPMFRAGAYEIQDEGSQIMALFTLWPREFLPMLRKVPGECRQWPKGKEVPKGKDSLTVIDACAGAGGKTLAMADALRGRSQVFAYDVAPKKLDALKKRATRAGLHNIKTLALPEGNEAEKLAPFHGKADHVLVDAPCSGWGTLRRNPDVKWRQEYDGLARLEDLQARLLDTYAPLVKVGGVLVFGVCTFRKAETTDQVEAFLDRNPEFVSIGGGYFGPGPSDAFFLHAFERKGLK